MTVPEPSTYLLFLSAALALLLTPGPAVLYIVARSVEQGRTAGLVAALGMGTGSLCHVAAATTGLSALLLSSAVAFQAVKLAGAGYLIYLGIRRLASREEPSNLGPLRRRRLTQVFRESVAVNVLNPKTALFFFAFLPQFVDPTRGSPTGQIVVLGLSLILLGVLTDGGYALLAGTIRGKFRGGGRFPAARYLSGCTYIALGFGAIVGGRGQ